KRTEKARCSKEGRTRPKALHFLAGALTFQGASGVGGGLVLSLDPSGESVGIPLEWLQGSPFPDYMVPGVILLVLLGIGPLVVAYGVWTGQVWSWSASVFVAFSLLTWLGVEIVVIGYHPEPPLQMVYGIVALSILVGAYFPSVRGYLRSRGTA
ncbi:MAG: hypothetical protein PVF19_15890, partial [Gemmatimonadota bacterium]